MFSYKLWSVTKSFLLKLSSNCVGLITVFLHSCQLFGTLSTWQNSKNSTELVSHQGTQQFGGSSYKKLEARDHVYPYSDESYF